MAEQLISVPLLNHNPSRSRRIKRDEILAEIRRVDQTIENIDDASLEDPGTGFVRVGMISKRVMKRCLSKYRQRLARQL